MSIYWISKIYKEKPMQHSLSMKQKTMQTQQKLTPRHDFVYNIFIFVMIQTMRPSNAD